MKGLWKDGKQSRKKKPWYKPDSTFKKIQSQKRRSLEKQALQKGKEEVPKFSKEYFI